MATSIEFQHKAVKNIMESMDIQSFMILQAVVAFSAYVQATIGFGLGMMIMAGIASFHLLSLGYATNFVTLVNLTSILLTLKGQYMPLRTLKKLSYFWILIPTTILGFVLLNATDGHMDLYNIIYATLGAMIMAGAIGVMVPIKAGTGQSPQWMFYTFFALGGLFGGLFGVAGAPIIYVVTIQPWKVPYIRQVMLTSFAVIVIIRLIWGGIFYGLPIAEFILLLQCAPAIVLATLLGRRHQHKVNLKIIRRAAFVVLMVSGVQIIMRVFSYFTGG